MNKNQKPPDHAPYGLALAKQVAAALSGGRSLGGHGHRDYSGVGFDYHDGHFRYFAVWETTLTPLFTFAKREKFEAWLAKQSEGSMASSAEKNSPTMTRRQLEEFVLG